MITWLSKSFATDDFVNARCVHDKAGDPLSHDNLFHSVLGLLDVQTAAYRPARDIFESCRTVSRTAFADNAAAER
jgi:lipid A ethanolaminephosphotransferase